MKKYQQKLMALAGLFLIPVFWLPLWSIGIVAPQYREGMGMFIGLRDIWGHAAHDIQNINILNHYIGMKPIVASEVDVLTIMPWVVAGLLVTALLVAAIGRRSLVGVWLGAFVVLGAAGMYEFYSWNYDYGHNLSPDAPLKVPGMTYTPPIIGSKTLLTIEANSYPSWGTLMITLSFLAALGAMGIAESRLGVAVRGLVGKSRLGTAVQSGIAESRVGMALQKNVARRRVVACAVPVLVAIGAAGCSPAEGARAVDAEFPAGEPCAYCDGTIGEMRFGGQITTTDGDAYRFMSAECMAGFVLAGRVAADDIARMEVVDYSHGERLVDATSALYVAAELTESPGGLGILATGEENKAANLHFFYGGTRLDWNGVLDLVQREWAL